MRKFLAALFLIFSIMSSVSAQKTPLLLGESIFGKVKQITEVECAVSVKPDGAAVLDSVVKNVSEFDTLVNIKERIVYMGKNWSGNNYYGKYTYQTKTDSNGNKLEIIIYSTYKAGSYLFNDKGDKVEFDGYNSDGSLFYKNIFRYNKKHEMISNNYIDTKTNSGFEQKFKYAKDGNLIEMDDFRGGKNDYNTNYTYESFDKEGNWTRRTYSGKFKNGIIIKPRVTLRQIIYYQ